MRRHVSLVCLALAALTACKDSKGASTSTTDGSGSATPLPVVKHDKDKKGPPQPIETVREKMVDDDAKKQESDYVPAEFKSGMARWKDVGVYLDGKPIGFLTFGELPIALKPTWIKDKVSAEKRPGTDDPGWRWAQQRFYKFKELLPALGVDLKKVKEIHVYGTRLSETIIATGKDLLSPAADEFTFRFGGNTYGKPIPHVLNTFGNGKSPDKLSGVMIYINKKPPTLVRNEGLFLDGVKQDGVPYYGEPLRGGVRVYVDDRLATIIKRQDLDVKKATKGTDGELHWKLADVLTSQGADLSKAQELWIIRDELRQDKPIPSDQFKDLTFSASSQAKGGILIDGANPLRANALAFHSRHLEQSEIPVVTPDDE